MAGDDTLRQPLRWRTRRRVFVNSMSDLFHENLPDEAIDEVFAIMALAADHEFQVLTKRAARMQRYIGDMTASNYRPGLINIASLRVTGDPVWGIVNDVSGRWDGPRWPLPNVWLGVSVENQRFASSRIPLLLDTPAAVRFVSYEPALGPVDFRKWLKCVPSLDWVIVGGESGPRARSMVPAWAAKARDQCVKTRTPFFFKQWGGRTPKAGGRELDGRTWDEMPR